MPFLVSALHRCALDHPERTLAIVESKRMRPFVLWPRGYQSAGMAFEDGHVAAGRRRCMLREHPQRLAAAFATRRSGWLYLRGRHLLLLSPGLRENSWGVSVRRVRLLTILSSYLWKPSHRSQQERELGKPGARYTRITPNVCALESHSDHPSSLRSAALQFGDKSAHAEHR